MFKLFGNTELSKQRNPPPPKITQRSRNLVPGDHTVGCAHALLDDVLDGVLDEARGGGGGEVRLLPREEVVVGARGREMEGIWSDHSKGGGHSERPPASS